MPKLEWVKKWFDATCKRFIRTGNVGYFDEDGFLVLGDRNKDLIIPGEFNVYSSNIEDKLSQHPVVAKYAVMECHRGSG